MSVSKSFQGCSRNILRLWICFCEVKKFKKLFCGLSCEIYNINTLICWMFFWTLLKPLFNHFSTMLRKGSYRCLTVCKNLKISTTLLSIHNMITITINLFCQVINISVCFTERKISVTAFFWHNTIWTHATNFFNCCYRYTSLPTRTTEPSNHWAFTYSKSIVKMSSKPQQKPFVIGSSPPKVFYNKEILKKLGKVHRKTPVCLRRRDASKMKPLIECFSLLWADAHQIYQLSLLVVFLN